MKLSPKLFLLLFLVFCKDLSAIGQNSQSPPKLVVGIVVDQMRYDYITRFKKHFTQGGFNRLLAQGYSCEKNYLNYVPTNTGPGHATIYTGTTPSIHGILNNSWYDANLDINTYCVADSLVEPVGTGSDSARKSPKLLLSETLGDAFKRQRPNGGKVISISIKDRAAVLSGGFNADAAYWFYGKSQGSWISSSYYMQKLPNWVLDFNDGNLIDNYLKVWEPSIAIEQYRESGPDNRPYERGFKGKQGNSFPYNLETLAKTNGNYDLIRATPFGNSLTLDFAAAAIAGERLGLDSSTDLLWISLSSTDYIGHNFGVNSKEVEDTYIKLDQDLEQFLNLLDTKIGAQNYTLFLTSDHGASENANYLKDNGRPGGYFKEATFITSLKDLCFINYGTTDLISHISGGQVYLNKQIMGEMKIDKTQLESLIMKTIKQWPQINTVITRTNLEQGNVNTPMEKTILNGFNSQRSGDVFYTLNPSVVVYATTGSSHGSGYEHDSHVPLLFYGKGIGTGTYTGKTNTADILPTLAIILGIEVPVTTTGTAINAVLD